MSSSNAEGATSQAPRTLTLLLPDWQHLDTILGAAEPFAMWQVGPQPLLHHWLDHAVNEGYSKVWLLCSDRPAEVRRAMEEAKLWPIEWQLESVAKVERPKANQDPDTIYVDRLPGQPLLEEPPRDGWELLRHWYSLRETWFGHIDDDQMEAFRTLAIGRFCSIHPSAELRMPVWIEDYVQIGPGCVVGPNVSVGRGAVLEGPSRVKNSVITAHTYLAGHTELRDCYLDGGLLLNLRHGARVPNLDMMVADSLQADSQKPPLKERVQGLLLYMGFSAADMLLPGKANGRKLSTFDGLTLDNAKGALWRRRRRWLKHVIKGDMRLFGVLPRTEEQLEALPGEWKEILRKAPKGVFAYSDLHGSHSPDDEIEPVHAVFQATSPESQIMEAIKENPWKLFRTKPADSD